MAEKQLYPESEKLGVQNSEWGAINQFLEFLSFKGVQLHVWYEGDSQELCSGTMFHPCEDGKRDDGRTCTQCGGSGTTIVHREGWTSPQGGNIALVYEYLDVDVEKLEAERRDMISRLAS